ncbi:MAG: hypothetical protein ACLQNE_41840 [Thermoguttaceae bacterium]
MFSRLRIWGRHSHQMAAVLITMAVLGVAIATRAAEPGAGPQTVPSNSRNSPQKVVVPFPLVSKWDKGLLGEKIGEMVWKKLSRDKVVLTMDAVQDIRDLCKEKEVTITPDTPMDKVKEVVRGDFDAQVGIWGSIERVPGTDAEYYDLTLKCVDFSGSEPQVIYEKTARTNSAAEVPHLYVKEMLDKLYNRKPGEGKPLDPMAQERWEKGPNLVVGGDFESGSNGVPKGWEPRAGHYREPLGKSVKWIPEPGNPKNHVIHMHVPKDVAEFETLFYYSKEFPVHENSTYRFQCRWRSNGPTVKVFIKCYDEMPTDYHREETAIKSDPSDPSGSLYAPSGIQRREVYRSQQNLKGPNNKWNTQTEDFTPKHTKYSPKWGRVDLLIYLTEGDVEFDDVVIKEIIPAPSQNVVKEKRHSLATKVTLKEMEENERRGKDAREEMRKQSEEEKKQAKEQKEEQ